MRDELKVMGLHATYAELCEYTSRLLDDRDEIFARTSKLLDEIVQLRAEMKRLKELRAHVKCLKNAIRNTKK